MRALLLLLLSLAACSDDDSFAYRGRAGTPVAADFADLIPEIAARFEGGQEQRFLCDSGSPITFLDATAFPGLADGKHQLDLAAFGLTFPDLDVASWDAFGAGDPTAGIIGGDLMRHFAFTMDYQGGRVWLSDPFDGAARPANLRAGTEVKIPMQLTGGGLGTLDGDCSPQGCGTVRFPATRILLQASFEALPERVYVMVDSGASFVLIDDALLATLGTTGRPRLEGAVLGTIDGLAEAYYTRVWRLGLGQGDARVELDDMPVVGLPGTALLANISREVGVPVRALIGGAYLRYFLTTLDYQERALRLSRYDQPTHVDPDEFIGPGFTLSREGDDWVLVEVFSNRDAFAKGLRRGDSLEEVAGIPIRGQPGEVIDMALGGFRVGEEVEVKYRRGVTLTTARVRFEDLLPHFPPPA